MTPENAQLEASEASQDRKEAGAVSAPTRAHPRNPRTLGGVRRILGWVLLVALIALLWPATWGGLFGVTVVSGHSMEPAYETNDVVLTVRQMSYEVGDVVSYKVPQGQDGAGGRVIHRIIAKDDGGAETSFTTQGDNNPSVDPWSFTTDDVVGEATLRVPRIGAAFSGSNGLLLGAVAGFAVLVVLWPFKPRAHNGAPEDEPAHAEQLGQEVT